MVVCVRDGKEEMSRGQFTCEHCGAVNEAKAVSRRSGPQHRRFFAIVRAAFFNWPEGHPTFRPKSAEHLRFWLEMRAGHFTVTTTARITSADPDKVFALMSAFMRHSDDHTLFVELDGNLMVEKKTLSIDYATLGPAEFGRLKEAVCEVIEAEMGIAAEKLLSEAERAA